MNKSISFLSLVAAGASGVALVALVDLSAIAGFAVAETVSFAVAAALVAFAIADYTRNPKALLLPVTASATPIATPVAAGPRARAAAYGLPANKRIADRRIAA